MRFALSIAVVCMSATACLAQQQTTPAETALQINTVIGQWAQTLTQQGRAIDDLQKQIAAKDARIKELEKKPDAPK